jgi:Ras GTPase-activating-like protein IQGAP2/3
MVTVFGMSSGKMDLRLEDLLETKFNKTPHISLFDGMAKVNVNLFLHLINKKFFS